MKTRKHPRIYLTAILGLAAAASAPAGMVSWGAATTIVDDNDVSIDGTLVAAFNLGTINNTAATVRGVTFNPFATTGANNISGDFTLSAATTISGNNTDFGEILDPFDSLSLGYKELLDSGSFTFAGGGNPPANITLTMAGLTAGREYQFQWWANASGQLSFDPQPGPPPFIPTTTASAGGTVTLARTGLLPGDVGQYAIGTFTADAGGTQVITFSGTGDRNLLNGFQLRDLGGAAVPEPGTCLFGLALSGFLASRRQRLVAKSAASPSAT